MSIVDHSDKTPPNAHCNPTSPPPERSLSLASSTNPIPPHLSPDNSSRLKNPALLLCLWGLHTLLSLALFLSILLDRLHPPGRRSPIVALVH